MTKRLVFSAYASNLSELERALEAASIRADSDSADRNDQPPFGDTIYVNQLAVSLFAETLTDGSVVYNLSIEDAPLGVTEAGIRQAVLGRVAEQQAWIARCGSDLAGYVRHYGSINDERHHGDGGEAIYAADINELRRLQKLAG